jgi:hypothetical protein
MPDLPDTAPWWAKWINDEWSSCWKWFSVQGIVLLGALPEAYASIPEFQQVIPANYLPHVQAGLAFLTLVGRLMKQSNQQQKSIMEEIK